MQNKTEYYEISRAKVSDSRNIVISNCSRGGFTIAQQLEVTERGTGNSKTPKKVSVFMKGAFHVDDIDGLYNLRDAINLAIKTSEEEKDEDGEWDDQCCNVSISHELG